MATQTLVLDGPSGRRSGITPYAATGAPSAGSGGAFLIDGFISIQINGKDFELRGTVGASINVAYHASFEEAINLGTIPELVGQVASALGIGDKEKFTADVTNALDSLANIPVLNKVAQALQTWQIKITDLAINTGTGVYQFGFAVDLTGAGYDAFGIRLDAFGIKVTYTSKSTTPPPPPPPPGPPPPPPPPPPGPPPPGPPPAPELSGRR